MGLNTHSDGQRPLPHHSMLQELHPTELSCLQLYSGPSPIPLTVSKQAFMWDRSTGLQVGKLRAHAQLGHMLSGTPERRFVL